MFGKREAFLCQVTALNKYVKYFILLCFLYYLYLIIWKYFKISTAFSFIDNPPPMRELDS